jgi:phosphatidylinositol dimannoside acyltransferase
VTLRTELRALTENIVLPGLAAVLPWRWCMVLFRRLARWELLYHREWTCALATARRYLPIDDDTAFARDYRLVRLIDHADLYLSWFRSRRRWIAHHVDIRGAWPADGAHVGVFFHAGPGFWGVHALRLAGHDSAVLAGHYTRRSMGGAFLGFWYGVARLKTLQWASGCELIFSPGTLKKSGQVLGDGHWVIGTPDVPPENTRLGQAVTLLGRPAVLPAGLVEIARRAEVPIVIYDTQVDLKTGRRILTIGESIPASDDRLLQRIAERFEVLLRQRPSAFSLWPFADAYFNAAASLPPPEPREPAPR